MVLSRTGFYQTSSDQGSSGASEARTQSTELTLARATPHINRVLTASGTYSPCGGNTRGSQTHGLAYVGAHPRPQCRAHATRFGQRRLRFACLDRMQPVARQRSSVQPVAACVVRSGIAHRWHSVATLCMWLQHSACGCVTLVLRRGRCPGGQQWWHRCRRGMDAVPAQMWAGDGLEQMWAGLD